MAKTAPSRPLVVGTPRTADHPPASGTPAGSRFTRALDAPTLTLLTLGGVMGSGLFLASGMAIRDAGPGVAAVFALGLLAMTLEILALAEMTAADPTPGSFLVYSRRVLGPGVTFVTGWIYWFSSVLTMSSEVTAAALFTHTWTPAVPLWIWSLAYSALIVAVNLWSVRGFGQVEAALAGVKAGAVVAFLLLGTAVLTGAAAPAHPLPTAAGTAAGLLPHGAVGAGAALLLVLFSYAGTGVLGMAAAETSAPRRTIPQVALAVIAIIGVLYLGSVLVLTALIPWSDAPVTRSPFVQAVQLLAGHWAAGIMNLVLLTAVLSTMNAALYANARVLYSLAAQGEAPAGLARLNARGLPVAATWTSAGLLVGAIILAYALPHRAYTYLVTATGLQAMFIWVIVLLTHLAYRPFLLRHRPQDLGFRLPAYPYTTLLAILIVLLGLWGGFAARAEVVGSIAGAAGIALAALAWWGLRRRLTPPKR